MSTQPARGYAILMAKGREQLQGSADPQPEKAYKTFLDAYTLAVDDDKRIEAIQLAGVAARKAGLIFEALETLTSAHSLAERSGNSLLIATTLRDLGAAYQTIYNRRYRIESAEDRVPSKPSDDGAAFSDKAYRRAKICYERSISILRSLMTHSANNDDREAHAMEYEVSLGFQALFRFQRARHDYNFFEPEARLHRREARRNLRDATRQIRVYDNRIYEVNSLKRALRVLPWFERGPYLVRALQLVLGPASQSRGDLKVILASALGDRIALAFEMEAYSDESIYGKTLPTEWNLAAS